jgi:hypothetical protein
MDARGAQALVERLALQRQLEEAAVALRPEPAVLAADGDQVPVDADDGAERAA